ncbi:7SK snRNA methylphosphate capping enzyme [Ambystoma mexicanum]|uniref:7SK snRNA methylphosphate capping enzyme n=1 Tax=Ambystoma mexicanum TaxID=8296 RepID=UPI0037E7190D
MQNMIETPSEKKAKGGGSPLPPRAPVNAPAGFAPPSRAKEPESGRPRNGFQPPKPVGGGKRRNSFHVGGFKHPGGPFSKRRRRANSDCEPVLPSNFLLGGNIFDPLNLNSLLDEEVNRALNAETPCSSPLPRRGRDPVQILVPRDITDPLSLNQGNDGEVLVSPLKTGGRKRHRHRHHPTTTAAAPPESGGHGRTEGAAPPDTPPQETATPADVVAAEPLPYELNTTINCRDEVVNPVLPAGVSHARAGSTHTRTSHGGAHNSSSCSNSGNMRHRKRKHTSSKSEVGGGHVSRESCESTEGKRKISPERAKGSGSKAGGVSNWHPGQRQQPNFKPAQKKFQYGNYCKYYGYRNPGRGEDPRLRVFKPEWFEGKEVLDLGCNVGHISLSIAKHWKAARVVGVDIDGSLITAARQNVRHYLSDELQQTRNQAAEGKKTTFPLSLVVSRGPIIAPQLLQEGPLTAFPNNVMFIKGNYVLERDELLEAQNPEYDVILCLSMTKWVHLNWGDEGLKRLFKRIYRHLRPGGIFLLEPQSWPSYGKRKNLTEAIYKNYCRIRFKPEQFTSYLVSPDVGFTRYELVGTPQSTTKGFQRPIYLFHKSHPSSK